MHLSTAILSVCVLTLTCSVAFGKGDATTGKALAEKNCIYCHGLDGNGNKESLAYLRGGMPRIAGQPLLYLVKSMNGYKSGTRIDNDMNIVSEYLSEQDILDLASWYAEQEPKAEAVYSHPY